MAVIEWVAVLSPAVLNVAMPPLNVPVPSTVAPSSSVMVPVGVPVAGLTGTSVAVNIGGIRQDAPCRSNYAAEGMESPAWYDRREELPK